MLKRLVNLLLPLCGIGLALLVWWGASKAVPDLPSPARTWEESKIYIVVAPQQPGHLGNREHLDFPLVRPRT